MKYSIQLVVGDWSNDGHGCTKTYMFDTNYSGKKITKAFKNFCKNNNIELARSSVTYGFEILQDFGNDSITRETVQKMQGLGINFDNCLVCLDWEEILEEEGFLYLSSEEYSYLWLEIVKLELPDFKYKQSRSGSVINIGGYGLFDPL